MKNRKVLISFPYKVQITPRGREIDLTIEWLLILVISTLLKPFGYKFYAEFSG